MSDKKQCFTGRCLCGAIRFRVNGPIHDPHICHCGMCRVQSGHCAASAKANKTDFSIEGDENVTWFQSSALARRGFCRDCGSVLFWDNGSDNIGISLGSLNQPTGLNIERHIFVEDKADYYEIDDDLPK